MSNKQKLIPLKSKVFAIQEEKANRRKLRILQVRQQERVIANRVRENVEKNKKQEILNIAQKLNQEFNLKKAEEILKSKEKYSNGLKEVGQAQNAAKDYVVEHALYQAKQSENKRVATHRFNSAIQHVHDVEVMNQQREQEVKERRIKVLSKEKLRAKQVSMLPSVSSSTQESEETVTTATRTSMRSCDTFCATMHEGDNDEGNAREAAEEEDQLIEEQERLKQCTLEAQRERAQLRYLSAIKRSKLHKEYNNLEKELQVMQKKEASRRRDLVGMNHPHCLPPHHPSDYPNDKQREMEQAFNDAFTSNIIPDTTLDVTMESELQDEIPQAEDIVPVVGSDDVVPVDENEGRETPTPENGGRINAVNKLLKLVSKQQARGGSGEEKCDSGTSSGETTSEEEISQPTDIDEISEVSSRSTDEMTKETTETTSIMTSQPSSMTSSTSSVTSSPPSMTSSSNDNMSIKDYQNMLLMKHGAASRNKSDDLLASLRSKSASPGVSPSPVRVKPPTHATHEKLTQQNFIPTKEKQQEQPTQQELTLQTTTTTTEPGVHDVGSLDKIAEDIARREAELRKHQTRLDECKSRLLKQQADHTRLLSSLDTSVDTSADIAHANPYRSHVEYETPNDTLSPQPSPFSFTQSNLPPIPYIPPRPVRKRAPKPPVVLPHVPVPVDIVPHDLSTIQEAEMENSQTISANQTQATLLNRSDVTPSPNGISTVSDELKRVEKQMRTVQESLDFMRNNFKVKSPQPMTPHTSPTIHKSVSSENTWGGLLSSEHFIELPPQLGPISPSDSLHTASITSAHQIAAAPKINQISPGIWKETFKQQEPSFSHDTSLDSIKELLQRSSYIPVRQPLPRDQTKVDEVSLESIDRIKLNDDISTHASNSTTTRNSAFSALKDFPFQQNKNLDSISIKTKSDSSKSVASVKGNPLDANQPNDDGSFIGSFVEMRPTMDGSSNENYFGQLSFTKSVIDSSLDDTKVSSAFHTLNVHEDGLNTSDTFHTLQGDINDELNSTLIDEHSLEGLDKSQHRNTTSETPIKGIDITHHSISEHSLSTSSSTQSINIMNSEFISKLLEEVRLAGVSSRSSFSDDSGSDTFKEPSIVEAINVTTPTEDRSQYDKGKEENIDGTFKEPSFMQVQTLGGDSETFRSFLSDTSSDKVDSKQQNKTIFDESLTNVPGILDEHELTLLETSLSESETSFGEFSRVNIVTSESGSLLELPEVVSSDDSTTVAQSVNIQSMSSDNGTPRK